VNGKTAVQGTEAIFDTGTTLIIGDPARIALLYLQIPGALPAPEYGVGLYTSMLSSATDQLSHTLIP
jgi:cathepsin D